MDIQVTITDFIEGKTVMVDEHPIVNDKDYVDIVTTPNELHYSYDNCECQITGNESKKDLIKKMKTTVIFDTWFEENWMNNFSDYGIQAPVIYDFEEDTKYAVDSIDDFVNNCKHEDCYHTYINALQKIAEDEYSIKLVE